MVTQEAAANLTPIKGNPTPPTLTQGLLSAGRYRRTAFDYYAGENSELVAINSDFVEVEVKGSEAAIYFDKETWLITMGTPPTAPPDSVLVKCSETGSGLSAVLGLTVGVEQKSKIFYQVTTASAQSDGLQIMVVNPGASWYRAHYKKVP